MKNPYQQVVNQYKAIDLEARVESASPYELIDLLLHGAKTHIATATGHLQRNQISEKGEQISKAINIVEGLKVSLDLQKGGEIAQNLLQLYDYMQQLLIKANSQNNPDLLAQANQLLSEIHQAWQGISDVKQ